MKKGDLYYLTTFPKTKVLITKNYNKRKFHDDDSTGWWAYVKGVPEGVFRTLKEALSLKWD